MARSQRTGRAPQWIAAAAAVVLPFSVAACGSDDTAGPETGTDVEDITEDDQYFASDEFAGQTVTISAEVEDVLSPKSFVLNGDDWGDDSVLVLSAQEAQDLQEDDIVQVTGTVKSFTYDDYAGDYGLAEPGLYEAYGDEEFIEATKVDQTVDSATPTSAASATTG